MEIVYLLNSGFMVKDEDTLILFDDYDDPEKTTTQKKLSIELLVKEILSIYTFWLVTRTSIISVRTFAPTHRRLRAIFLATTLNIQNALKCSLLNLSRL